MLTYIAAFIFYTLAMIGIIFTGFIIYKKTSVFSRAENKGMIKILDTLPISPKKNLLVVKIKNEKFLIASGAEHTTFLSKLSDEAKQVSSQKETKESETAKISAHDFQTMENQRMDNIQKQFRRLYSREDESSSRNIFQPADRKEMIRKLLKDLNDTGVSSKTGSY